ncbi:MAG: carbohydrate ABC transporter permease [Lachnospiraceae bacterium]|nr:carbohydrate ABC transporter permease [Lachnospiraceae bacterium]
MEAQKTVTKKYKKYKPWQNVLTVIFAILSFTWILPIIAVVLNAFKSQVYIFNNPFGISTESIFKIGIKEWAKNLPLATQSRSSGEAMFLINMKNAIEQTDFWHAFLYSVFITIVSVALILLCCSMCAYFITRVHTKFTKLFYLLCLFSMIVPFQMVMFTLSKFANMLHLYTPWGITIVYLGFGAGLSVFMYTGFIKSMPIDIEEAAMIDGCTPLQTYFQVVFPIMKPTTITIAILQSMWIWNDYLLPSLVLDVNDYKTIPIAIQYLTTSHGNINWGAMMAALLLAIIPIVIFYLAAQKYIIEGVMAGAVKG